MDLSNNLNIPGPSPANISPNSPYCELHRQTGYIVTKSITIAGTGAEVITNLATFTFQIDLHAIYGVFTGVTNVVTVTNCYWDLWDGTNSVPLTAAAGVNCSGAGLNSLITKSESSATVAYFANSTQVRLTETVVAPSARPFFGGLFTAKNGVTNYIRFRNGTDVNTNCSIMFFIVWACRYPGSNVVAV